ncbi:hypothetical protein BZM26_33980 [Paraburkholderia strydomiana]|nr:hypothetical protein BZM26_33980 [Paraburkholderia strydomiana]
MKIGGVKMRESDEMRLSQNYNRKVMGAMGSATRLTSMAAYFSCFMVTIPILGWALVVYFAADRSVKVVARSRSIGTDMTWIAISAVCYFVANLLAFFIASATNSAVGFIIFAIDLVFNIWLVRRMVIPRLSHVLILA